MMDFVIKYWLEVLFSAILTFICFGYKVLKNRQDEQDKKNRAIENGVQALLRNELITKYREYETRGEMTIIDKENIEHLFTEYQNLGGNGTIKQMYEELLTLPIKIVK